MKKRKGMLVAALLVMVLTAGVAFAFMFRSTAPIQNIFKPARVACLVEEVFDGSQKDSIKVKNDGNIDCYVRVRLVSYWVDAEGQIVGKSSDMPEIICDEEHWSVDKENETYYYKKALKPEETTEYNLLKSPLVVRKDVFLEKEVFQVIEVFAEAIQAEPEDAKEAAWPLLCILLDFSSNIVILYV